MSSIKDNIKKNKGKLIILVLTTLLGLAAVNTVTGIESYTNEAGDLCLKEITVEPEVVDVESVE